MKSVNTLFLVPALSILSQDKRLCSTYGKVTAAAVLWVDNLQCDKSFHIIPWYFSCNQTKGDFAFYTLFFSLGHIWAGSTAPAALSQSQAAASRPLLLPSQQHKPGQLARWGYTLPTWQCEMSPTMLAVKSECDWYSASSVKQDRCVYSFTRRYTAPEVAISGPQPRPHWACSNTGIALLALGLWSNRACHPPGM